MSAGTYTSKSALLAVAVAIASATATNANTAAKVGGVIRDLIASTAMQADATSYGVSTTETGANNVTYLQAAIDDVWNKGGGVLNFPAGTFPFSLGAGLSITWRDGVYLRGSGMRATVLDFSGNAQYSYDNGIFLMQGAGRSNPQGVTVTVARGALSATVADAAGYASGDIVQLRSTENYVTSDGGTRAEFLRVRYVSGNVVYFTTPTVEVYNIGSGTVQLAKMSFATGGVCDLTLKGKGSNPAGWPTPNQYTSTAEINDANQNTRSDYGFEMRFCRDVQFERVRFIDVENQAIYLQACYGGNVHGCTFEFSAIQERSQYGVAIYRGTSDVRVEGNFCINCRHFVTTGSTSSTSNDWYFGVPHNITIVGNTVLGAWQDGIDTHRAGFNIAIVGNVLQCYYAGIKTRGQKVLIADNIVYGPNATDRQSGYDGIQVQFFDTDVTVADNKIFGHDCGIRVSSADADGKNLVIRGNTINDCGAYGIRVTTDGLTLRRVKIEGNTIDTPALYGIYPDGNFEDLTVKDNTINGGTYGIRTPATGSRFGIDVSGNILRGQANDPIYLELCNSITVCGNQLYGANTNGVHLRLRDCRRGTVVGNHVTIPSGSSGGSGIYLNCTASGACSDLVVDSNEVFSVSAVGTGIAFDAQSNQYHTVSRTNNCRTCATEVASSAGDPTIRNEVAGQSVTIASDTITACTGAPYVIVDTEGAAASDNLSTINYSGRIGEKLTFRQNSDSRDVTFKDGTGNLRLAGDCVLTFGNDSIMLEWRGSTWSEVCRSING